jgi:ceramide glucosyltransferase
VSWWALPALAAAAYQLFAIIAALRWRVGQAFNLSTSPLPPISILKPMYGRDERLYQALRSHALQKYPEFEILFGVRSATEPALEDIQRLRRDFPSLPMRVIQVETEAPNAKVGVLARLAAEARHPLLVINDDDIEVQVGYLEAVTAPLRDSRIGLVTCLYRARAESFAARVEALGVAGEFASSVMVARLLGVGGFALGATMAMRAETLARAGGFEPIEAYLADDYELGRRVTAAGYRVEFAPVVVETGLGGASWLDVWRHQLRWARTIRVSRTAGYYGSVVTHAVLWALLAFTAGEWYAGVAALVLRVAAGWLAGAVVLKDPLVKRWFWLLPLRDLFGLSVWAGGCFGSTVYWRGLKLRLLKGGKIGLVGQALSPVNFDSPGPAK